MSDRTPLMPKATAVWLVDNTSLTFTQIAEFCGLHVLEVKGIADGDVAQGIRGLDPITRGQITRDEIERGEKNPDHKLKVAEAGVEIPEIRRKRYTPLSLRQEKPNAVLWLLRNCAYGFIYNLFGLYLIVEEVVNETGNEKSGKWRRFTLRTNSWQLKAHYPIGFGLQLDVNIGWKVHKGFPRAMYADRIISFRYNQG